MGHYTRGELAAFFDHTALKTETDRTAIEKLCREAMELGTAAVCVNPVWIEYAAKCLAGSKVKPITVIGFPLGASATTTKVFEAKDAILRGAKEIDMVLAVGLWKSGLKAEAREDIRQVKAACGSLPLKVIFETSLLTPDDIKLLGQWCAEDGVAFVKTSTGFGSRGASVDDVRQMKAGISSVPGAQTKIKASGGISTLKAALELIDAGADRIGASATLSIVGELSGGSASTKSGY